MGSKKFCISMFLKAMVVINVAMSSYIVQGQENIFRTDFLDSFIHDYSFKKMVQPRTGTVYNISLPTNYSGIDASIVRLRSGSFYNKGVNHSFFRIPPRVLPWPPVTRFDIVYQNLGNWSSTYYNVPNHTFVAPVVGVSAYFSNSSGAESRKILLTAVGDPIQVHFPIVEVPQNKGVALRCVLFGNDGEIEFSNTTDSNSNICNFHSQGHYSIVVPYQERTKKKTRLWKWWVVGFAVGVVALVLLLLILCIMYKVHKANMTVKMERESEKSEALGSIWIGVSKMPSASGIRTERVLEHSMSLNLV